MESLGRYLEDGADAQAKATLSYLQMYENVEESYNHETNGYDAKIMVARWDNYREQGYVVSLVNEMDQQMNIAFFQHRNSDDVVAVKWMQSSIRSLTIDTADFGDGYKDKHDVSKSTPCGDGFKMAIWISQELDNHWIKGINK